MVVTALIRVEFLIDVGLLYSSVFLVGLVVVIVVMVGLVVVVSINYCGGYGIVVGVVVVTALVWEAVVTAVTTICLYSPGPVPAGQLIGWEFIPIHS